MISSHVQHMKPVTNDTEQVKAPRRYDEGPLDCGSPKPALDKFLCLDALVCREIRQRLRQKLQVLKLYLQMKGKVEALPPHESQVQPFGLLPPLIRTAWSSCLGYLCLPSLGCLPQLFSHTSSLPRNSHGTPIIFCIPVSNSTISCRAHLPLRCTPPASRGRFPRAADATSTQFALEACPR